MIIHKLTRKNGTTKICTEYEKPSRVDDTYKTESNINVIVERFQRTGNIPMGLQRAGQYMDTTQNSGFADFALFQKNAQELFDKLPNKLKKEFGSTPTEFLANMSRIKDPTEETNTKVESQKTPDPKTPDNTPNNAV